MPHNTPTFSDFFSLFEQPIDFDIDKNQLNRRLRQLQQQFHPDKLNQEASFQTTQSAQNSSVINHAYNVLMNPDSRANYLLELAGQEVNVNATIADLDFLEDAMQMRMSLDDAASTSNLEAINSLKATIKNSLESLAEHFKTAYAAQNWSVAIEAAQKLRFLVKLDKDLDSAIDEIHTKTEDDDLYL